MGMFGALDAASTGVDLGRIWMNATADNIANVDTVRPAGEAPYRAREVVAAARDGLAGVKATGIVEQGGEPAKVFDPENPLADKDGYVTRPQVDMATEMSNMMLASRLYQANLSVMQTARESYQAALQIGRQ